MVVVNLWKSTSFKHKLEVSKPRFFEILRQSAPKAYAFNVLRSQYYSFNISIIFPSLHNNIDTFAYLVLFMELSHKPPTLSLSLSICLHALQSIFVYFVYVFISAASIMLSNQYILYNNAIIYIYIYIYMFRSAAVYIIYNMYIVL